jgi:hypothetical protein
MTIITPHKSLMTNVSSKKKTKKTKITLNQRQLVFFRQDKYVILLLQLIIK